MHAGSKVVEADVLGEIAERNGQVGRSRAGTVLRKLGYPPFLGRDFQCLHARRALVAVQLIWFKNGKAVTSVCK